ncbi:hypothetical protein [Flavobacterium sp. HNIBRBA15423]|uniref:hypothetical protein n=1 Tax=Flavobacterium sp. HNIBRBA15423 TaxID=3458683 RepID=UPI004043D92B
MIPVKIRDHLIPFLFQEMEGTTASYDGQKVKMVRLLPSSSLANYLYSQIGYEKKNNHFPNDNFLIYLSIEKKTSFIYSGTIYIDKKGVKEELYLPLEKIREINNLLEDIFRISMVSFIDGVKYAKIPMAKGIIAFIEKYNLDEYGFENETIRKMYYKQKKKSLLSRVQIRSSNKVLGFF